MKSHPFLRKLHKQQVLKIKEPNNTVATAYLEKAQTTLISAKTVMNIGDLGNAVGLAYSAMYYSALALLFHVGIKCENHTAVIILLNEIFGLDNKPIEIAKKERIDKQYYVDFSITKQETKETIVMAEEFLVQMNDFNSKISNQELINYRSKIKKILQL